VHLQVKFESVARSKQRVFLKRYRYDALKLSQGLPGEPRID